MNSRIISRMLQTWRSGKDSDSGASLVEMLVALGISVLVFSILSTALVQFILTTRWGNSQLQASNDIQVASLWLGRDALEAASFTPGAGPVYGTLSWADSSHQFRYSYDSAETALVREHLESGLVVSTNTVARHISAQGDVAFSLSGNLLTVTITSTSGQESQSASLDFAMRTR